MGYRAYRYVTPGPTKEGQHSYCDVCGDCVICGPCYCELEDAPGDYMVDTPEEE